MQDGHGRGNDVMKMLLLAVAFALTGCVVVPASGPDYSYRTGYGYGHPYAFSDYNYRHGRYYRYRYQTP
jgi:hypothetical protein